MKVVVTGAAGMIGSNLVHGLNAVGIDDVIAVDDLTDGPKYRNLLGARISDYFDRSDFYTRFARAEFGKVDVVLHEGACSDTMEHNGRYMLDTNYRCSKDLLDACQAQGTRLLYASSAATYGGSASFREEPQFEQPLNVYGWSKLVFDNVVRRMLPAATAQVAGFRYFNVYGPREQHKGRMASVAFHHFNQLRDTGRVKLFGEYGGYAAGEESRDFVFVDDVVAVKLLFHETPTACGILHPGTRLAGRATLRLSEPDGVAPAGVARASRLPLNDVARRVAAPIRSTVIPQGRVAPCSSTSWPPRGWPAPPSARSPSTSTRPAWPS